MKKLIGVGIGLGLILLFNRPQPQTQKKIEKTSTSKPAQEKPQSKISPINQVKPKLELSEKLQEVEKLQTEVDEIFKRTQFDHRKMTEKEFENAVRLLEIYNQKMIQLTHDVNAG